MPTPIDVGDWVYYRSYDAHENRYVYNVFKVDEVRMWKLSREKTLRRTLFLSPIQAKPYVIRWLTLDNPTPVAAEWEVRRVRPYTAIKRGWVASTQ